MFGAGSGTLRDRVPPAKDVGQPQGRFAHQRRHTPRNGAKTQRRRDQHAAIDLSRLLRQPAGHQAAHRNVDDADLVTRAARNLKGLRRGQLEFRGRQLSVFGGQRIGQAVMGRARCVDVVAVREQVLPQRPKLLRGVGVAVETARWRARPGSRASSAACGHWAAGLAARASE